jgi:hypothetical protein
MLRVVIWFRRAGVSLTGFALRCALLAVFVFAALYFDVLVLLVL